MFNTLSKCLSKVFQLSLLKNVPERFFYFGSVNEGFYPSFFGDRDLLGKMESRRVSASASFVRNSLKLTGRGAYIGLFRGGVFLGRRKSD